ncbi:Phosphomannomutase/phosphoglucomutase, C-terminal fragment [Ectocarpus siliculosus]|uniref:Phosphomannomutase/phosphoglucomutase, C-terminal n=1 Tax=Ectocarpus siliculosus TaxID=2880 RepID=D7FKV2_ECTSI|nr:Phosphomannomutase/phosphoglucomutase, C-terminal fragment [Ectocarpus siliculosus]
MYAATLKATEAAAATVSDWQAEETNFEGLRVKVDEGEGSEGWLMNRMSLHEPIVIFNVESEVEGGVAAIAANLLKHVLEPLRGDLDLSSLDKSAATAASH